MKKTTRRIIFAVVILVLLIIIILPKVNLGSNESNASEEDFNQVLEVDATVVIPSLVQDIVKSTGSIMPNEEVALSAEQAGLIKAIYFDEGTYVSGNDLLVKINDADLQAQLRNKQYQLDLSTDREYRQKQLLAKEAISQEEYDQAMAGMKMLQAEIDFLRAQIAKTEVRAPFSGIVGLRRVSPGDFLAVGQTIANLVNVSALKIEFAVADKYAGRVQKEDVIEFTTGSFDGKMKAAVYAIEPKIDPETRTLTIRAKYHNNDRLILPGGFANVTLVLQEMPDALQVPTEAIIPELGGQKVFLYQNGKVMPAVVETGIRTADHIQITAGIDAGDTVITSGLMQIRQGMPVRVALKDQEQSNEK